MNKILFLLFFLFPIYGFSQNYDHQKIKQTIIDAVDPWVSGVRNKHTARPLASQIIHGLYLGNDEKFAETLPFPCRTAEKKKIDTSNPHQFKVVISLCTYSRMAKEMPDLAKVDLKEVEKRFQESGIYWMQLGQALPDDKNSWSDLVFNATFLESELAREDLEIPKKSTRTKHVKLREAKRREVKKLSVDEWFEPTFKILDEAVFSGKKTLVHCFCGVSRSPTLVAAYLINRFGVSSKQAIAFLRSKRSCVNPKCASDLKAYGKRLKALDAKKRMVGRPT